MLVSPKMAFFVVILNSKYSNMTPKFLKQKSHWLHSSIKFANPVFVTKSLVYLTNKCHVVMYLFSNRSQMMSKSGKNKEVAHKPQCVTDVLTTFWCPNKLALYCLTVYTCSKKKNHENIFELFVLVPPFLFFVNSSC